MKKPLFYADLHVHPSMKPFYSGLTDPRKSMWDDFPIGPATRESLLDSFVKQMVKYSQCNFTKCIKGHSWLLFNSLYPVEVPWFSMTKIGTIIVNEENRKRLSQSLTNFNENVLESDFFTVLEGNKSVDYFNRLEQEYHYILTQEDTTPGKKLRILKDYNDYKDWKSSISDPTAQQDPDIALIITIEGAHSFFNFENYSKLKNQYTLQQVSNKNWPEFDVFKKMLLDNIESVKQWGPGNNGSHAPLFITFTHHFWNLLAGHAQSIGNIFLNQNEGMGTGFTKLGRIALTKLLEKGENSRRILIDIKHLSPEARTEFYDLTKGYSLIGDKIPILASHAAVTGTKNQSSAPHMYFNSSDINLYDEDILKIARTNGLIGLMLEEGRLLNKQAMKALCDKYGDHLANSPDVSAEILIAQMLHIVNVCGSREGWDIICIGSDFDGMINSLDAFDSVEKYPDLFERIHKLLTDETPILQINWEPYELHNNATTLLYPSQSVHNLKFGLTPDEIIEKIAYKNIENFLEKYFNDGYLKSPSENQAKTIA